MTLGSGVGKVKLRGLHTLVHGRRCMHCNASYELRATLTSNVMAQCCGTPSSLACVGLRDTASCAVLYCLPALLAPGLMHLV